VPIVFTRPAEQAFSNSFKAKIADVFTFFPELHQQKVMCGLIKNRGSVQGVAKSWTLPPLFRIQPAASLYTISHELTHLVQGNTSGIPHGEIACDIWTIDRMPLRYLDQIPYYLLGRTNIDWDENRKAVKTLCRQAIELRSSMRTYITWLKCRIKEL
jgi:hypothetical protein